MTPTLTWRRTRPIHLMIATTMLAGPASAVALTTGAAAPETAAGTQPTDAPGPLNLNVSPRRIRFGANVTVTGATRATDAGRTHSFAVLAGQAIDVRGTLRPGIAGRSVHLQGRSGRRWNDLASAHTGSRGGFDLHFVPGDRGGAGSSVGSHALRLLFSGDRANARSWRGIGQLTVYNQSVASWYDDAGGTASGFHATFGVANRTLPFGTKVMFRYGARSVTAVVDDRGPFVSGRDWDLNQNTAAALGFSGVGTVWSTM
jgi:rare lipoprotein A